MICFVWKPPASPFISTLSGWVRVIGQRPHCPLKHLRSETPSFIVTLRAGCSGRVFEQNWVPGEDVATAVCG